MKILKAVQALIAEVKYLEIQLADKSDPTVVKFDHPGYTERFIEIQAELMAIRKLLGDK